MAVYTELDKHEVAEVVEDYGLVKLIAATGIPSGTVNTRSRGGSTDATTKASVARGTAGMTSPSTTVWSSGTTRLALGVPPLSMASQLYHPARPAPICAIHGQTWSGAASIVMA